MPPKKAPETNPKSEKPAPAETKTTELAVTVGNQAALELADPVPLPHEIRLYLSFETKEQLNKHLDLLSVSEIQNLKQLFSNAPLPPAVIEKHIADIDAYLNIQFKTLSKALSAFSKKNNYTYKRFHSPHELFGHSFITLYPLEENPEQKAHLQLRKTVHRPILDIELVGRRLYARCYLGLYAPDESGSHKDITADEKGRIRLNQVNQMNLGNPFKAMLWAEDYLVNTSHYQNGSQREPPHPVVRTFLVPLEEASALLNGEGDFGIKTRPVDQDRASGQFSNKGDSDAYDHLFTPLNGSLVSFFYSAKDFSKAPVKGQTKYSMEDLVEYLTGAYKDLKDFGKDDNQWSAEEALYFKSPHWLKKSGSKSAKLPLYPKGKKPGIAAQYNRGSDNIVADSAIRDNLTAYYASLTETGFSAAVSIEAERRSVRSEPRPRFGGRTVTLDPYISNLVGITEPEQLQAFLQAYMLLPAQHSANPSGKTESESDGKQGKSDPLYRQPQKIVFSPSLFHLMDNPGQGDCLFHALEGRTLNHAEILRIRAEVAGVRSAMPDTGQEMGINAQVVAMNLLPIPIIGDEVEGLIQGRHQVPNALLAQLQAIPGVYAGDTEIRQWTRLRQRNVYILEGNGTWIHFAPDGTQTPLPAPALEDIPGLLTNPQNVLLYKYPNHWVRITGLAQPPGKVSE